MRYFFGADGSGHWYMIPEPQRTLWEVMSAGPTAGEDEEDFYERFNDLFSSYRTGGGIQQITFEHPASVVKPVKQEEHETVDNTRAGSGKDTYRC